MDPSMNISPFFNNQVRQTDRISTQTSLKLGEIEEEKMPYDSIRQVHS